MVNDQWEILDAFNSESEARVVESFLRAQGIDVQLLDTHVNSIPAVRASVSGMRLMVRASDLERAREALAEAKRPSHLEIIGQEIPIEKSPFERWAIFAFIALAALVYSLTH